MIRARASLFPHTHLPHRHHTGHTLVTNLNSIHKRKQTMAQPKSPLVGRRNIMLLVALLIFFGFSALVDLKNIQTQLADTNMSRSDTKIRDKGTRGALNNDGCGLVNSQHSSQWIPMTESESEDVNKLQECLKRTVPGSWADARDYHNINPSSSSGQLNCSIPVTFDTVRSALSQYKTVWMHGDSIMAQTFYTLGCMMNSSIEEWNGTRIGEILWRTGLGYNGPEQFTYTHSFGSTKFMFSRFGKSWGLDKNLYEDDFPMAIRTLNSRDAIVTNGAAVHNNADAGSKFEKDVDFIVEHSKMTNATTFFFEPTPTEWPTSNGMYLYDLFEKCKCQSLTEAQLLGVENNYTSDKVISFKEHRIVPDSFFNRTYPNSDLFLRGKEINSDDCIPNCVPNFWHTDVVREGINKSSGYNVHVVPIYWQLVSRPGGSYRSHGDCTHKDLHATTTMLFQWTRTILGLEQDNEFG